MNKEDIDKIVKEIGKKEENKDPMKIMAVRMMSDILTTASKDIFIILNKAKELDNRFMINMVASMMNSLILCNSEDIDEALRNLDEVYKIVKEHFIKLDRILVK